MIDGKAKAQVVCKLVPAMPACVPAGAKKRQSNDRDCAAGESNKGIGPSLDYFSR